VLVVGGSVVFWACAAAGKKHNVPANNIALKRKPALIRSRSVLESPLLSAARAVHARHLPVIQAFGG
jgi:hypothetical protein